jgi:hypothetical protein
MIGQKIGDGKGKLCEYVSLRFMMLSRYWLQRLFFLNTLSLLVAILFSAYYLVLAIARVLYPYDLDFLEEAVLMQAWRVAQSQPVYVAPGADYTSLNYPPLYTWLGGLLLKLTGPGFLPLRLLSLAATLATAVLIYKIGRRESQDKLIGLLCAALFLAGYRVIGGWYELARVDALFVALILAGSAVTIYFSELEWGLLAAGALMALSLLAKQQGAFFILVAAGYLLMRVGRRVWLYLLAVAVVAGLPLALLQLTSQGWLFTYIYKMSFDDPREWQRLFAIIGLELFGSMAVLTLAYLAATGLLWQRWGWRTLREQPWLLFIGSGVFVMAATRLSVGAARNTLMPGYTFLCLAPAVLAAEIGRRLPPAQLGRDRAVALLKAAILIQFALTVINPIRFLFGLDLPIDYWPSPAMRASGDRFIGRLSAVDGEVLVLMHPYYAILAGKEASTQIASLWHARYRGQEPLPADLVDRIQHHYYAAIISDESEDFETDPALMALIEANYMPAETLLPADAPPTLTGVVVRPRVVYVPR